MHVHDLVFTIHVNHDFIRILFRVYYNTKINPADKISLFRIFQNYVDLIRVDKI